VCVVPGIGTLVDAWATWSVGRRLRASGVPGPAPLRGMLNALTVLTAAAWLATWAAVFAWPGDREAVVAAGVALALVVWSLRHAAMAGLIALSPLAAATSAAAPWTLSAWLAPTLVLSLIVVGGLGGVATHIVLFPPFCLLLPLWLGGAAVWGMVTIAACVRLSRGDLA